MRALVYHGPRDVRYEAVPDPELTGSDSAIVRVSLCSICGSDLHPYHTNMGAIGYCIGHEAVGEVVEIGADVGRFAVGDRVLLPGSISCGSCPACSRGNAMLCQRYPYSRVYGQGQPGLGGCQAEAVEVPVADANLHLLPPGMSDELGVMLTDTLATAWLAAKRARIQPGGSVAVIALGAVGLQCVMAAFALGADRVFALDHLEERRTAAAQLGAIAVSDGAEEVRAPTAGLGVDSVIDATGGPESARLAVDLARKGGTISILGVPEEFSTPFPLLRALAKNLDVALVACSIQAQLPELFTALEEGRLDAGTIAGLLTHRMPLAQGPEAYELFDARRDGVLKVVLTP
jgi:threonine dehydrogenase-like Zn-dependent dehydrogenase